MKAKSLVLFVIAAAFGLVAMLGVMQVINAKPGKEPTVRVLTAVVDIPSGMPLDDKNVAFKEMPQSAVPAGAVTKEEEFRGKAIVSRTVAGEIIMAAKLGGDDAITASHQIPKGMRVATVSVDATKSHSGLIRPTDRVDVVCAYTVMDTLNHRQATHVKTVLEFIEVFAVDKVRAGREGEAVESIKNVSLLVNPEQYQLLIAAEKMGDLDLSLRNRSDVERTEVGDLSDSVFFQHDTSVGSREDVETTSAPAGKETPEESQPAKTAKTGGLGDFLTAAMSAVGATAKAASAETSESGVAEPVPTWTMTICRGTDMEDVEVLDEAASARRLSASERQRARAEVRASSPTKHEAEPKASGPAEPKGSDAKAVPAGDKPAGDKPAETAEPATAAQPPKSAPVEPAAQAAVKPPTTPALLPFTPFGAGGN